MSDRLRGSVSIMYTVNLGNYQSIKVDAHTEFWQDEKTVIAATDELDSSVKEWMKSRGVALQIGPEGYPGWIALTVAERGRPVLVHWNWFAERIEKGLPTLEVGQEVEFDTITRGSEYDFVRNFKVKEQ